jgi:hypothetical protein
VTVLQVHQFDSRRRSDIDFPKIFLREKIESFSNGSEIKGFFLTKYCSHKKVTASNDRATKKAKTGNENF